MFIRDPCFLPVGKIGWGDRRQQHGQQKLKKVFHSDRSPAQQNSPPPRVGRNQIISVFVTGMEDTIQHIISLYLV